MPRKSGLEAIHEIKKENPDARILVVTSFTEDDKVFPAIKSGALGYLLKDVSGHDLADAVRTIAAGGALIEPSVARRVVTEFARMAPPRRPPDEGLAEPLSDREREILRLLAQGLSNREIADRLTGLIDSEQVISTLTRHLPD